MRLFLFLLLFSISGNAIFSSAPSDLAFNATRLHNDVLNMMNAEISDVKTKYEQTVIDAQVYVDRANALMVMQSVRVFLCCVVTISVPACLQAR